MKLNPYLAIIIGTSVAGSGGVFIKLLDLPATSLAFFRTFIPVILLLGYFAYKKQNIFHGNIRLMLFASGLNATRLLLFYIGFLLTTIGNAIVMLYTWPIFATIISIFYFKERVSNRTKMLIGLAFLGIIIMFFNTDKLTNKDIIGMLIMMMSAIIIAVITIIFKKELINYSKTETVFYQNIVGAVVFLPFLFVSPFPSLQQIGVASIYGFLTGIFSFMLFFYALERLEVAHYSLFTFWEVPAAMLFAYLFLGELITINIILGGSLIVVSGILLKKVKISK